MTLRVQQHLRLPVLIFTHAGLVTASEALEGCHLLLQLCETEAYDIVIDLTEAMYVWESGTPDAMTQMLEVLAHPNIRYVTYVIPDAEHHDLAELLREGYAHANLTYKLSFADTVDDAITQIAEHNLDSAV